MAEKEDGIFIQYRKDKNGCIDCKYRPNCSDCQHTRSYSKQEAIEKMAKAICLERNACISKGEMCGLCELWRNFSTHAEAALNALLGDK